MLGWPISDSYSGDHTRSALTIPGVYVLTLVILVSYPVNTENLEFYSKSCEHNIYAKICSGSEKEVKKLKKVWAVFCKLRPNVKKLEALCHGSYKIEDPGLHNKIVL